MSETVTVSFYIADGIITKVAEIRGITPTVLTSRRDIENAVDRVANTPVGGKNSEEKP